VNARLAGLAILALLAGASAAAHARAPRACELRVAHAGTEFFARSMAVLASCQERIGRGALPAGTECTAEPAVGKQRAALAARLVHRARQACTDAAVTSLAFGGHCAGTTSVASLAGCLQANHEAEAETLVGVADAARGALSAPAERCQAEASRRTRGFAVERLRLLGLCKRRPPHRLPAGADCDAEPRTAKRIAALRARAVRAIGARCVGATVAGARFGPPCAAPADGESLAGCLLAAADVAGEDVLMAEYRNEGFCGDSGDVVERRIRRLLGRMPLAEKIAQMHGTSVAPIGGVYRTPGNDRLGIPGLGMIDGPRGVSVIAGHATAFPVAAARGATWDTALEERVGEAIGTEARAKGATVILAPVLNILRHPRWGRAQETYGEDTVHLGSMGVGFIRGAQRHVVASAKHLAANSIENTRFEVDVSMDERTLREVYLPHFRVAVEQAHAGSIMAAYNKLNGQHCAENVHLLHDILKGEWGFRGFVESDWVLGVRSTAPSANAGLDIEMPSAVFYGAKLADAVAAGDVSEATVDAGVRRILRTTLCFRLDSEPPVPDPSLVESPAHLDLAREVARQGIVLLKNEHGALPLDRSRIRSLAVVGALAAVANLGDRGSSNVSPSAAVTPLDGIRAQAGDVTVTHLPATPLSANDQAVVAAADAALVVAGLTADDEGEGQITPGDRKTLALPGDQDTLVASVAALNPRTVVVLEGGSAITMPWVDQVAAILMAWYPGQEGGNAIADVLFGAINPSGKLPVTFPRSELDLPEFVDDRLAVTYGYYHGYRHLDREGIEPLFPFGFGLSYTTFGYSNLTIVPSTLSPEGLLRVTADVTNTGGAPGDEIAQLYVSYPGSRVDRAVKDLKAFGRVHLEPGETRTVEFELRAADLAFYDVAAGAWEVEPIAYAVRVGPSSRDLPLVGTFAVAATALR